MRSGNAGNRSGNRLDPLRLAVPEGNWEGLERWRRKSGHRDEWKLSLVTGPRWRAYKEEEQ